MQIVIVGSGAEADRLEALALARFAVNKTVVRVEPSRIRPGGIPEALEEMLINVSRPQGTDAWAMVCRGRTCLPPITTGDELLQAMNC